MYGDQLPVSEALIGVEAFRKFAKREPTAISINPQIFHTTDFTSTQSFFSLMVKNFSFSGAQWYLADPGASPVFSLTNSDIFNVEAQVFDMESEDYSPIVPGTLEAFKTQADVYDKFKSFGSFSVSFKFQLLQLITTDLERTILTFVEGYLPAAGYCIICLIKERFPEVPQGPYAAFEFGLRSDRLIFDEDLVFTP